jgi:DNA processing protein
MLEWLTLLQCPNLGIASLTKLHKKFPSLISIFDAPVSLLKKYNLTNEQIQYLAKPHKHQKVVDYLSKNNIKLISIDDPQYPFHLYQTCRPPIALFAQGDLSLLKYDQIAVVGTRTPSEYGIQITEKLVADLVSQGYVITSGLALGIDTVAHKAALNHGGSTIAVLGTGHAHIYPKRNQELAKKVAADGLLLSEFLPFTTPKQFQFPQRNRVIAGLSKGTLVTEAATRSGSLITAQFALDENRDVFATPGNLYCDMAKGTNKLIQQGAKLVMTAADIVEEYQDLIQTSQINVKNDLADNKLLVSVDLNTTPVDVISKRTNLPVDRLLSELLELEMQGFVAAVPGGYIRVLNNSNNKSNIE